MRRRRSDSRSSAGYRCCGHRLHRVQADLDDRIVRMSSRAANGWPTPATTSTTANLTDVHMAREVGMRPRPHRSPRLRRRAVRESHHHGHPGRGSQPAAAKTAWSTSPTPRTAATCFPARRCFPTAPMSGGHGSPAVSLCPTRSPANPAGPAVTSPPPGPLAQPLRRPRHADRRDGEVRATAARWWGWTLTTDTSPCGASMHTATRSADPNASTWTSSGSSARRDAQVRHAITRLIHYTHAARHRHYRGGGPRLRRRSQHRPRNHGPWAPRQTLPSSGCRHPNRGVPQPAYRPNPPDMASALYAVNPAYTSAWGDQHWRTPYENVTRHEAAATVIGRRAQGFKARRRKGVTRTRPEDRVVRATNQAAPDDRQVSTRSRHRPGTRGTKSRPPDRARTRHLGRATVTPAPANNGYLRQ